jgi:DNA-binding transcriptional ArsR family regulator
MSLGDDPSAAKKRSARDQAALRAMAHPIRLRIMSLLTGASLTAAEVARELGISHANASYHLRNLLTGGLIVPAGEEKIRGGIGKRYRYDAHNDHEWEKSRSPRTDEELRGDYAAIAHELIRRTRVASLGPTGKLLADAELWLEPETWKDLRTRISELVHDLHDAAQPPRTPGTMRTSTTVAMFEMITPETEK